MICANCLISIEKNKEYLKCLKCNSKYCIRCIEMDKFYFDEITLLYKYSCKICMKL